MLSAKPWLRTGVHAIVRFIKDDLSGHAAALAFTSLLSLVPLLAVMLAILSISPVFQSLSDQIQDFIFSNFVAGTGEVVQTYLQQFVQQAGKLSAIGFGFLFVTAILLLMNMEEAFNSIWHIKKRRRGLSAFLLYWTVLTVSPLLIGLSFALSSYLASLPFFNIAMNLGFHKFFLSIAPFFLNSAAFSMLYIIVPNTKVPFKNACYGGILAAGLFELAKFGFTIYIVKFSTYHLLYGALATIPIFLIWIYLSWMILLFGVLISHILTTRTLSHHGIILDGFTHGYLWLGYLYQAHQEGKSLSLIELCHLDQFNYQVEPEIQIENLLHVKLIQITTDGSYILARDLHTLNFETLTRLLPYTPPLAEYLSHSEQPWFQSLSKLLAAREKLLTDNLEIILSELYTNTK